MSDSADRQTFFDFYTNWIGTLFNQAFEISGYVIKFEWLPSNNGTVSSVLTGSNGNLGSG